MKALLHTLIAAIVGAGAAFLPAHLQLFESVLPPHWRPVAGPICAALVAVLAVLKQSPLPPSAGEPTK